MFVYFSVNCVLSAPNWSVRLDLFLMNSFEGEYLIVIVPCDRSVCISVRVVGVQFCVRTSTLFILYHCHKPFFGGMDFGLVW